jgi:hypothetical protein
VSATPEQVVPLIEAPITIIEEEGEEKDGEVSTESEDDSLTTLAVEAGSTTSEDEDAFPTFDLSTSLGATMAEAAAVVEDAKARERGTRGSTKKKTKRKKKKEEKNKQKRKVVVTRVVTSGKRRRGGFSLPPPKNPPLPTASRSNSRGRVPWVVGLVNPINQTDGLEKYAGVDSRGFGFSSFGTAHYNGKSYSYCSPTLLMKAKTLSLVVNLQAGQVGLMVDAKDLGVAFGPDSVLANPNDLNDPDFDMYAQGEFIRGGKKC